MVAPKMTSDIGLVFLWSDFLLFLEEWTMGSLIKEKRNRVEKHGLTESPLWIRLWLGGLRDVLA